MFANEVIHKKLGDILVRAATTASRLEAEQDNDNINKIQSKATPSELSSQGTSSGGGPRVKKLEKRNRSRTHKLKGLYKVGLTARVESSKDEDNLGEDVSKQRRHEAIDQDEVITLVNDQDDADMFDVNDLGSEELVQSKEKRAREELVQERTKKQMVEDDKETVELKQLMEIIPNEEEVEIDVIPLAVKSPKIVDWKIYKERRKSYYQIIRADEKTKIYMVISKILEIFQREDLEDLYKLLL
nr:hypothetical protein [Tanacetum cinerariifolium]